MSTKNTKDYEVKEVLKYVKQHEKRPPNCPDEIWHNMVRIGLVVEADKRMFITSKGELELNRS